MAIPAELRRALGLRQGDEVILVLEADGLRLRTVEAAVKRAQDLVGHSVPRDVSLSDELIAERRDEERRAT